MDATANRLGFWSALLAAIFSLGFFVTALLGGSVFGVLKLPWDPDVPDGFSLLLAWSFIVMMVCVHRLAPEEKKVWSQVGLSFAMLYAAMVSMVYFLILTLVTPLTLAGQTDKVALLTWNSGGSFMQAIDGLGYGFMSLATLFAAFSFGGGRTSKYAKWAFVFNGVLVLPILASYAPLAVTQPYYTAAVALAALWAVSVPLATFVAAVYFRRGAMELEGGK